MSIREKRKKVSVKAWMFLTEDGGLIGMGQGSNEYFYSEEAAKNWQIEMSAAKEGASFGVNFIRNIFGKWKLTPIIITYELPAPTPIKH